jgi:hypothetical protein
MVQHPEQFLRLCDNYGACSTSTAVVNVLNVARTINSLNVTDSLAGPLVVAPTVVTVVFSDPASQNSSSAMFTYANGAPRTVPRFQSGQLVAYQFREARLEQADWAMPTSYCARGCASH